MNGLFIQLLKLLGVFFVYGGIVIVWMIGTSLPFMVESFLETLRPWMKSLDMDK